MKYVALLRGIGPGNPNMRNDKLCEPFEKLGYSYIQTVISSGNVLFESDSTDINHLEEDIQQAIELQLGFSSTVIIKSKKQIEELIASDPFNGLIHGPSSYLLVTFFKHPTQIGFELPHQPENKTYKLIYGTKDVLCTITDNTQIKTTDLMAWLEKQYSKEITSRTWKTLERILARM